MDQLVQNNQSGGGHYVMEECYQQVDLDQAVDLPEVDGKFLTKLLEDDTPPFDPLDGDDVDGLSRVIRSLEVEIGGTTDGAAAMVDSGSRPESSSEDGGRLENMLPDLEGYEGEMLGYWSEVPLAVHDVENWYVYMEGCEGTAVGYEQARDHQYYYAEGCVEQVYSPLWE
ncbi:uncharacterized protein LOC133920626 [Phragmites australis]|uniref:uncharacterized protein LOC133920626 n=1 Tax=Phragmites australis TaxID=29695 RepID=UPI002D77F03F|nr:uncharacterized protein LOC133920626 [Phragmites australis]